MPPLCAHSKTVCSSVAVIPPPEVWPPLEAIRRIYDTGFVRWPPHVNMLYPFLHNFQFPEAYTKLAAALADFPSFTVTLKVRPRISKVRTDYLKHSIY